MADDMGWMPVVEREPRAPSYPPIPRAAAPSGTLMGFIDHLRGVPTEGGILANMSRGIYGPSENERLQNDRFARDDAKNRESQQAIAAIGSRIAELRSENPQLPPEMLQNKILQDKVFFQHWGNIDATKQVDLVNTIRNSLFAEPQKPVSLVEGGKLVVPTLDAASGAYTGSQTIANNPKSHDKVETESAKITVRKAYDLLGKISEEGTNAQEDLANIAVLEQSLAASPTGPLTALRGQAAAWGIPVKGASDLQIVKSMIDRLTPKQRVPGSGATSDKEMAVFKSSLPSLINTPKGNEMILGVMKALAQDRIERADIANQTFSGMSPQEAFAALRERKSPLAAYQAFADPEKGAAKFESMSDTQLAEQFRSTTDPKMRAAIRAEAQRRKGAR